jgi:ureidoglycolate lyase
MSTFDAHALLTDFRGQDLSAGDSSALLHPQPPGARICLEVLRPQPHPNGDCEIRMLERHPLSAQVFISLDVESWVHVVAPSLADGSPDLQNLHWRLASRTTAIIIKANAWHAPLIVLEPAGAVAMMMWRLDPEKDTDVWRPSEPVRLGIGQHGSRFRRDGPWQKLNSSET